uniref:CsbD family protein n=1 Tax=Pseudomonas laurentiana TaxID=2364649 RepID=UPI0029C6D4BC|nr:CsbD family protein [Pseudomonas laurentiana]
MNKDQVKGRVKEIEGTIKEVAGKTVGNKRLEEKGKIEKTIGSVQAGLGDLKEDLKR